MPRAADVPRSLSRHAGGSGCRALFLMWCVVATLGPPASLSGLLPLPGAETNSSRWHDPHSRCPLWVWAPPGPCSLPGVMSSGALHRRLVGLSLVPTFWVPWCHPVCRWERGDSEGGLVSPGKQWQTRGFEASGLPHSRLTWSEAAWAAGQEPRPLAPCCLWRWRRVRGHAPPRTALPQCPVSFSGPRQPAGG